MTFISFGKWKKKNFFIISSIILSYLIYQFEYYSSFYYDCLNFNTPHLFALYFSFTSLGNILFGGILYIIIEKKSKTNNDNITHNKANQNKNNEKGKKNISIALLYDDTFNEIKISIKYFIFSSLLEFLSNFSFSIVLDFIDIESKMLFNGFEIIIIKIIGTYIFKNYLYKHQIISIIILLILLILGIVSREEFLRAIINNTFFINESIQKYIQFIAKNKTGSYLKYYYIIFVVFGNITNSLSIWVDNWIMTVKLCNPYKLLFFKGLFGIIPSLLVQILLFYLLGERDKIEDEKLTIINLLKRVSFPFSSFNSLKNIIFIFLFFIFVGLYQFSIIYTNNKFQPEFVGFVIIFSSGLSIITNEINILLYKCSHKLFYLIPIFYFIISLIMSLIICEIIILHFCGCDKNTSSNIDKRATLEANSSFQKYIEDQFKEEEKVSIDDISNDSKEN